MALSIKEFISLAEARLSEIYQTDERSSVIRFLLEETLNLSPTEYLFYDKDTLLSSEVSERLEAYLTRLQGSEPLQHILGYAYFLDLKLAVSPSVLIPRPETEELISIIAKDLRAQPSKRRKALDLGTGSGCIPLGLASQLGNDFFERIDALDISPEALKVAQYNIEQYGYSTLVHLRQADLFQLGKCPSEAPYDLIISNPPYIHPREAEEMTEQVLAWEPHLALFALEDNPILYYEVIAWLVAEGWLASGGRLYLELNPLYAELTLRRITDIIGQEHISEAELIRDLSGKQRFIRLVYQAKT